jgi:DNA-binding response OmpR family regulator
MPYASAAQELGFEVVCGDQSLPQSTAMLEFGLGSVDAWLRRLVRREQRMLDAVELDESSRDLLVDGQRVALTQLEFGVLRVLMRASGSVVGRDALLDEVWGRRRTTVGSNVVDVVVLALRKKLGSQSSALATVRGSGYRFTS